MRAVTSRLAAAVAARSAHAAPHAADTPRQLDVALHDGDTLVQGGSVGVTSGQATPLTDLGVDGAEVAVSGRGQRARSWTDG